MASQGLSDHPGLQFAAAYRALDPTVGVDQHLGRLVTGDGPRARMTVHRATGRFSS